MTLAAIDTGQLFELVWAAAIAGIVVATSFSMALVGFTRAAERRRAGEGGMATAYVVLGVVGIAAFFGAVVFGVSAIITK